MSLRHAIRVLFWVQVQVRHWAGGWACGLIPRPVGKSNRLLLVPGLLQLLCARHAFKKSGWTESNVQLHQLRCWLDGFIVQHEDFRAPNTTASPLLHLIVDRLGKLRQRSKVIDASKD